MMEDNGPVTDHYSQRRNGDHHQHVYVNGTGHGGSRREGEILDDDGAVHISHRISGINFTPTLHDSLVNEIRKLRNKLDKRENEVKILNEELDVLRESHDNLQETHDTLASNSSRDIRSLRSQLERNAAAHVSEVKALRLELQETTSAVHDLRAKLDSIRRAKSLAEEQRDKWKSELDELKAQNSNAKSELERRLGRETEKVKVLEDLVSKMESEIERSTMSVKSGSDRMSLEIHHETEDEEDEEAASPSAKHVEPGSPIQTLFAEMAGMEPDEPESEDEPETEESNGRYSVVQSPESLVSLPSIHVAQVLQSLRERPNVETVERAIQTEPPPTPTVIPLIRVLSPTPPLTNAPLIHYIDDVETVDKFTQTEVKTNAQAIQTDPSDVLSPLPPAMSPTLKSPILRPQNSIRRGSHSVRWQEEKSIQTEVETVKSVEIAIQTDPFVLAKRLKSALKTPTSETKEPEKVRLEQMKPYDGPKREGGGGVAKVGPTRRLDGGKGHSGVFGSGGTISHSHTNGHGSHDKRIASARSSILLSGQHARKVSASVSQGEPRRGRQPYPSWMKTRDKQEPGRHASGVQLHTPTKPSSSSIPPLPIPQRSSSKFRVVLPIIRDRSSHDDPLPEVDEEAEDAKDSDDDRGRRELSAFLARPPRKTVRQIRSAVNLRSGATEPAAPTPNRLGSQNSLSSLTPSQSHLELTQKSFSTPRKQPKRLVKLRPPPPPEETIASTMSPASSTFPTAEEMTVVDEIARCMVGEYMYKYVRRRRRGSFTWRRSPARQPNYADDVEESTIRHKRWVWLQPYEKMIMWSSSQPSQSNFLQRAQVKKRVVTNVLDVRDETPMISPSGSSLPDPAHNRSIVVLTPTQAIKFTALTRERHISWLTALNFLVHNDPADLIIPRGISASPSNNSLWGRDPVYPASVTATTNSITSFQGTNQPPFVPGSSLQPPFGSYTVRKNSLPDFAPRTSRDDSSPLGYKMRPDVTYATPPSVPRIPTGRKFEGGRERSGSGSAPRDWEDPTWLGGETIRMDAFVRRTPPRVEVDIDDNLFQNF